jgi:hypothetical protein
MDLVLPEDHAEGEIAGHLALAEPKWPVSGSVAERSIETIGQVLAGDAFDDWCDPRQSALALLPSPA